MLVLMAEYLKLNFRNDVVRRGLGKVRKATRAHVPRAPERTIETSFDIAFDRHLQDVLAGPVPSLIWHPEAPELSSIRSLRLKEPS